MIKYKQLHFNSLFICFIQSVRVEFCTVYYNHSFLSPSSSQIHPTLHDPPNSVSFFIEKGFKSNVCSSNIIGILILPWIMSGLLGDTLSAALNELTLLGSERVCVRN